MYLNKLLLKEFGKFNNKEIDLKKGFNLVFGEKESGKTTVKEFIVGMLYGINGTKGLGSKIENYENRKPNGGRGFSGKAYIKKEDKSYFVERSFIRNSKKTQVLDVQSGREIKTQKNHTLYKTITDVDKSSYLNKFCVGEDGDKSLALQTENFIVNTVQCGDSHLSRDKALKYLEGEYRKQDLRPIDRNIDDLSRRIEAYSALDGNLEEIRNKIKGEEEEFALETAKRKREARTLLDTEEDGAVYKENKKVANALDKLIETNGEISREEIDEIEGKPEVPYYDRPLVIAATAIFVLGIISLIVNILPFEPLVKQLFIICTALFIVMTIVDGLYAKGFFEVEVKTPSDEEFFSMIKELEEEDQEIKVSLEFAKEFGEKRAKLKEVEKELLVQVRERQGLIDEQNQWINKKTATEEERNAIRTAMITIRDISLDIETQNTQNQLKDMSQMISGLSNGRYNNILINENNKVLLNDNGNKVGIEKLPLEDVKFVYLAAKLCASKNNTKEKLPLVIDDIFGNWDKEKVAKILDIIKSVGSEQVILLTSNKSINPMIDDLGIDYNYVEL